MCRICGLYNPFDNDIERRVLRMRDAMHRGGPDDAGVFMHETLPFAMGHRRLSLIDLSANGHQPMKDEESGLMIVFNGEIYNFIELKNTLKTYGYQFRTNTDTEVVLKAYLHWGLGAFELFNGMFAMAIWDYRKSQLVLARDHAGMKPLYYSFKNGTFSFASEIRAFAYAGVDFQENDKWPISFLAFGHLPEPITTLKDVFPIQKGTAMVVNLPDLSFKNHPFFQLKYKEELINEDDAIDLLRTTLTNAVKRHMIADAPLGLFLSGGIDSSLLTILAASISKEQLKTLSIVFNEKKFSEEKYQQIVVDKTGTNHGAFNVTKEIFNTSLEDALMAMDQPSIDGMNTYFISKYARTHGLKAVLSGVGADELFGGYPSFTFYHELKAFQQIPRTLLHQLEFFPNQRMRKISYGAMHHSTGEYLLLRGLFSVKSIADLMGCSLDYVEDILDHISSFYTCGELENGNRISWLETNFYMQNQLLKDSDYMSMWHGLEIRMPYLDKELMMLSGLIAQHVKFNKSTPKYLLVKPFEAELPEEIWKRKKQGFTFPFEGWLQENDYTKPVSNEEYLLYELFQNKKLTWARYWCALLMNRFLHKQSVAA